MTIRRPRVLFGTLRIPGELGRVLLLLRAARAEFGRLSRAERAVVVASVLGEVADFTGKSPEYLTDLNRAIGAERAAAKVNDARDREAFPDKVCSAAWRRPTPGVAVRAGLIRWLLTCPAAVPHVHAQGVQIAACRVDDVLDCEACTIDRPILFKACVVPGVVLKDAQTRSVVLLKTCLNGLDANGANIRGDLMLRNGFCADGEVWVLGTKIRGNLECSGGSFLNAGGNALSADRAEVGGGVFLKGGFRAEGAVRLHGAKVHGVLACSDGSFLNAGGNALSADRAEVGGGVFLTDGFRAEGAVRLTSAKIRGDLACSGGSFLNAGKGALSAQGAEVDGTCFVRGIGAVEGVFNFTRAKIGYLVDGAVRILDWPSEVRLTGFRYDGLFPGAPLDAKTRLTWLANGDATTPHELPDPQPYRQLAEVLKRQGRERDARRVLHEFERRHAKAERALAWKTGKAGRRCFAVWVGVRAAVFDAIVGHGYNRWNALGWLAFLVLVGGVVFSYQGGRRMQPVQVLALREFESAGAQPAAMLAGSDLARRYPKFNPVLYSMDALIPLVSFHQEEYWTPRVDPRAKGWHKFKSTSWWIKIYHTVHISLGWIIATLFAASFTKLMRSD